MNAVIVDSWGSHSPACPCSECNSKTDKEGTMNNPFLFTRLEALTEIKEGNPEHLTAIVLQQLSSIRLCPGWSHEFETYLKGKIVEMVSHMIEDAAGEDPILPF